MATTTPNYGWSVPTSSDLVKDGATAIETLGDSIDASMFTALGTKKAGMVLLNTTSFSAVSSQSVNDVFSTTYDNYLLLLRTTASSDNINIRMRVSATDDTSANYSNLGLRITTTVDRIASYAQTSYRIGEASKGKSAIQAVIYGPFLAALTQFNGLITNGFESPMENGFQMGAHNVATSYTGFTLIPASGTMTGNVSVYGYSK
jgi:hypothetical protein